MIILHWHFWPTENMSGGEGSPWRQKAFRLWLINYPTSKWSIPDRRMLLSIISLPFTPAIFWFKKDCLAQYEQVMWNTERKGLLCSSNKYPWFKQKIWILQSNKLWLNFICLLPISKPGLKISATFLWAVNFWLHSMAGKEKSALRQDIQFWNKFCWRTSPSSPQAQPRGTACCLQACGSCSSDGFSCFPPYLPGCRTAPGTSLEMSPGSRRGWRGGFWAPKGTTSAWVRRVFEGML